MAGDWIKFEVATSDKPEVWAIAERLEIDPDAVIGKLLRVWAWFDQHTSEGNAATVTKKLLNRSVGVTDFCEAMVSVGWMFDDGEFISLPNFEDHNGKTAKTRAVTARRVAKHKKVNGKGNGGGVTKVTQGALPEALPREEKRREEKEIHVEQARRCIDHLNQQSGKNFHHTEKNLGFLIARFQEGYSEDDAMGVIDNRVEAWKDDHRMHEYLRPATLFNSEKFNQYAVQIKPKDALDGLSTIELIEIATGLDIPDAASLNTTTLIRRIKEAQSER